MNVDRDCLEEKFSEWQSFSSRTRMSDGPLNPFLMAASASQSSGQTSWS